MFYRDLKQQRTEYEVLLNDGRATEKVAKELTSSITGEFNELVNSITWQKPNELPKEFIEIELISPMELSPMRSMKYLAVD